jgi:hypothetical protein
MGEQCAQRTGATSAAGPGARGAGGLPVLLLGTFLVFTNYAALLSVVPMWASRGGAASPNPMPRTTVSSRIGAI